MRTQHFALLVTLANAGLLLALAFQRSTAHAEAAPSVVRAHAIEILDRAGQVRAALTVEESGEAVFRLRDAKGTIRVKLGASEEGSGLLLLDGATEPGLHALSRTGGTTLTLRGKDGKPHRIGP
jgi:hypothetical protein